MDKWSGSIEVGITTHNPGLLDFPATMTNMRSGTTMMSGTGILTNGKGTHREYGEFNLDELKVRLVNTSLPWIIATVVSVLINLMGTFGNFRKEIG